MTGTYCAEHAKVEQIAFDMSKLQGRSTPENLFNEQLRALGDEEPRIAEFFKDYQAWENPPNGSTNPTGNK